MNATFDTSTRDNGKASAFQVRFDALRDQLLLSIRDGQWHKVSNLALWLAPRVKADLAVHWFLEAGGTHDKKFSDQCGEGQALILKDMLDGLRHKKLLGFRTDEAGEKEVQATPLKPEGFEIDAEFEKLLPRAPDEVKKLEERLLVEEQREPLVVWKGHGKLVDGHTRFRFYSLLGRKFHVVEMDFPDRTAVISWLYDTHYGRRSYAPEMKAYVRGKQYLARKNQHGGARRKASPQSGNLKTADLVAGEYGIGRNTLLRDAAFANALDKVAEVCGDEVRQKVLSRVARWTKGDVARMAKLDQKRLQEIVRVALASGKRPKIPPPANGRKPLRKAVNLPLGKPLDQVRVLKNALGGKGLVQLQRAITRFLKRKRAKRHATSAS